MMAWFRPRQPEFRRVTPEEVLASLEPFRKAHTLEVELAHRFRSTTALLRTSAARSPIRPREEVLADPLPEPRGGRVRRHHIRNDHAQT